MPVLKKKNFEGVGDSFGWPRPVRRVEPGRSVE
jgi:hypothetical protein